MSRTQITVERRNNGLLVLSAMVGGHLVTRIYAGYTVREARAMYRANVLGEWSR